MNRRRRSRALLQFVNSAHVIDVRMRTKDLFGRQPVFFEAGQNFQWIVAWIDDDGFTSLLISQNRAVALKPADGKCFDDHRADCAPRTLSVPTVALPRLLKSVLPMSFSSPGGNFWLTTSLSVSRTFPRSSMYVERFSRRISSSSARN